MFNFFSTEIPFPNNFSVFFWYHWLYVPYLYESLSKLALRVKVCFFKRKKTKKTQLTDRKNISKYIKTFPESSISLLYQFNIDKKSAWDFFLVPLHLIFDLLNGCECVCLCVSNRQFKSIDMGALNDLFFFKYYNICFHGCRQKGSSWIVDLMFPLFFGTYIWFFCINFKLIGWLFFLLEIRALYVFSMLNLHNDQLLSIHTVFRYIWFLPIKYKQAWFCMHQ